MMLTNACGMSNKFRLSQTNGTRGSYDFSAKQKISVGRRLPVTTDRGKRRETEASSESERSLCSSTNRTAARPPKPQPSINWSGKSALVYTS